MATHYYWRTTQFLFPIYGMFPGGGEDGTVPLSMYVPIDDEHTLHWGLWWHPSEPMARFGKPLQQKLNDTGQLIGGVGPMKPHQTGQMVRRLVAGSPHGKRLPDEPRGQEEQELHRIPSVRLQDDAVITSMGPILDRTKEHLGTADAPSFACAGACSKRRAPCATAASRRPGSKSPELYRVRSCQAILPTRTRTGRPRWTIGITRDRPSTPSVGRTSNASMWSGQARFPQRPRAARRHPPLIDNVRAMTARALSPKRQKTGPSIARPCFIVISGPVPGLLRLGAS